MLISQPFFVLHKASSGKSERNPTGSAKARRRIDLSASPLKNAKKSEVESAEEFDDDHYADLRSEAFESVWSNIESTIKVCLFNPILLDIHLCYPLMLSFAYTNKISCFGISLQNVLRDANTGVFNKIHRWVRQSFNTITSLRTVDFSEATQAFPVITDASARQLFTGFVLTSEFSD